MQPVELYSTSEGEHSGAFRGRTRKILAAIACMSVLAGACSSSPETTINSPAISTPIEKNGETPTPSANPEEVSLPTLKEGEALSDTNRIDSCKAIMSQYGYVPNIDLGVNAPADRILSLHLNLLSDAYRENEPRLLWCVYPVNSTGYLGNRDNILDGNDTRFPTGWSSMEELSREDSKHVMLRWTFQDLQGSTLEYTGEFEYTNGVYLVTKMDSVFIQDQ